MFGLTGQGYLRLPGTVRHWCGLVPGDRVLVAADPDQGLLVVHLPAALDTTVGQFHAVAAALTSGKAGLDQFTDACVRDADVLALRGKVEVISDDAFSTIAAAVDITTADGAIHKLSQAAARGSDVNPMDDAGLEHKLKTAAAGWEAGYDAAPLIDAIWALDEGADVSKLASLAVPR